MTEQEIRGHVIAIAESFLGAKEGSAEHKRIIDLYNSVTPRPRGYKVTYSDNWCDTFVTTVGDLAGVSSLIGRECGVEEHIAIYKALDIWNEDGTIIPDKADIICYNWDDKTQPNDGWADHTGYVVSVNQATGIIKIVEGNKSDSVAYRNISIGAGQIRGYAKPNYVSIAEAEYFYKNIGWNEDMEGWWYSYGHNKGEYHCNTAVRIPSVVTGEKELFFFDTEGYCVRDPFDIRCDERGRIVEIHGTRFH